MPKMYEAIKSSYIARGKDYDEAQRLAAMTYNHLHPGHPMKPSHEAMLRALDTKRKHKKRKDSD